MMLSVTSTMHIMLNGWIVMNNEFKKKIGRRYAFLSLRYCTDIHLALRDKGHLTYQRVKKHSKVSTPTTLPPPPPTSWEELWYTLKRRVGESGSGSRCFWESLLPLPGIDLLRTIKLMAGHFTDCAFLAGYLFKKCWQTNLMSFIIC